MGPIPALTHLILRARPHDMLRPSRIKSTGGHQCIHFTTPHIQTWFVLNFHTVPKHICTAELARVFGLCFSLHTYMHTVRHTIFIKLGNSKRSKALNFLVVVSVFLFILVEFFFSGFHAFVYMTCYNAICMSNYLHRGCNRRQHTSEAKTVYVWCTVPYCTDSIQYLFPTIQCNEAWILKFTQSWKARSISHKSHSKTHYFSNKIQSPHEMHEYEYSTVHPCS